MWLLETSVRNALQQAQNSGVMPTLEQQANFEASRGGEGAPGRILSVSGGTAVISIQGVITKTPSFFAMMFGGGNVTYSDIVSALDAAENSSDVKDITLSIDSPGGHFAGLFDALAAIQSVSKPVKALVSHVAASAAYAIASQADEIVATNRAVQFGSVGVVATFHGSDEISITSTNAPKKRPDIATEEGRAVVREELDALHEIFVEAIAEGRGKTVENINAEFGQGATLLADEALKRGMIDAIAEPSLKVVKSATSKTTATAGGKKMEIKSMDLHTLKAEHPAVFAAAVQEGIDQERDRVTAHLVSGQASGMLETAIKAVEDGSAMTSTFQTKYLMAAANRGDINSRQEDDAAASAADGATASETQDSGDAVAAMVESKLGLGA